MRPWLPARHCRGVTWCWGPLPGVLCYNNPSCSTEPCHQCPHQLTLGCAPGCYRAAVLPREPGREREAVAWFSSIYPRTQRPGWPVARPLNIIQAGL
jgi:hypothetical protein